MSFDPKTASQLAEGLNESGLHLFRRIHGSPNMLAAICSSAVLLSLSVEVGIKALLEKHSGKFLRSHDHEELFRALPVPVQNELSGRFRSEAIAETVYGAGAEPPKLEAVLAQTKNTFEVWRYVYEPGAKPHINYGEYAALARALAGAMNAA